MSTTSSKGRDETQAQLQLASVRMSLQSSTDDIETDAVIGVMGPTGSGKSTFINLVSGSELPVGGGLESCTANVQLGKPFNMDGRRVLLIDTPGFDDTNLSDIDVLNMIALCLATLYKQKIKLDGILYFHRISDTKMSGTPVRNFKMFRELCGETTLKNVVIVTTMWEGVDRQLGERREAELMTKDAFFKPVLTKGGRMVRHGNNVASAERILRLILRNCEPLPLRIQEELVDENKDITETGAGEEINRELNAQVRKHKEEIRALREQMEQAKKDKDEETRKELEEETKRARDEIKRLENNASRLASDYQRRKEEIERSLREKAELDLAQYQKRINILQANADASQKERAELRGEIKVLQEERRGRSGFSSIFRDVISIVVAVGALTASLS